MIVRNINNETFGLRFSRFNVIFPPKPTAVTNSVLKESEELKPIIQKSLKVCTDDSLVFLEKPEKESNKFLNNNPFFAFWAHILD